MKSALLPLALLVALLAAALPLARGADGDDAPARPEVPWPHVILDGLLRAHVHDGVVDYAGLLKDRETLADYRAALADYSLSKATRDETLAFWIDAYNAFTLELILERWGTIESIKDIPSGKRWTDVRWRAAGRKLSLDQIEHEILRKMGEPRIHFAIVCASKSCPDLRAEAYVAERLDEQLDDAVRRFLSDPKKGLRTATESGFFGGKDYNVYLSKLFDWFEDDFETGGGSVLGFVRGHAPEAAVAYIDEHADDLDVEWLDYDWTLNDAPLK
ncbi:MAG: DUF547 domain-containing protein [Planctomycetes bacterium]|nr:DUF547 domain-containing protein [Planctomycetota bacterium]